MKKIIIWAFVLIVLSSFASAWDTPLHNYQLEADGTDTGSNPIDLVPGDAPSYVAGILNNAGDFEAGNTDSLTTASMDDLGSSRTIEFWFKPETMNDEVVFYAGKDAENYIRFETHNTNMIGVRYEVGNNEVVEWSGAGTITVGNWWHIVAVYGAGGLQLYVNGSLKASDVTTQVMANDWVNADIGENGVGSKWVDGIVDNLIIHDYNFSQANVTSAYNGGVGREIGGGAPAGATFEVGLILANKTHLSTLNQNLTFTYNSTNLTTMSNCELWTNESGSWAYEENLTVGAENTTLGIVHTFPYYTDILWNVYCNATGFNTTTAPLNHTLLSSRLNITGTDALNGSLIKNFNIYINGTLNGSTTTSGYILAGLTPSQAYNIKFDSVDHEIVSSNATTSGIWTNVQFQYVYTHNSFNITFYDEMDGLIIDTTNITVEFIADNHNYTYNTVNGTMYVDLLNPSNYSIRYIGSNLTYNGRKRHYYLTLTNRTHTVLDLYLISIPTDNITINVYDQVSLALLEGAVVYLQKRLTDNNFYTVAMYETGANGEAYLEVERYNEYYKFLVDYPFDTLKYTSDKVYIESTQINLYVPTTEEVGQDFYDKDSITYGISYDNTTNEFVLIYTDSEASASSYCLDVIKYGYYGVETINSSCSSGASSTISVGGMNENITYYALFEATINNEEVLIATGWKDFLGTQLDSGRFGLFMTIILFMVFAFMSAVSIYAGLLGSSALVFAKLLGLLQIEWPIIFGIVIVAIIVGVIIESKK